MRLTREQYRDQARRVAKAFPQITQAKVMKVDGDVSLTVHIECECGKLFNLSDVGVSGYQIGETPVTNPSVAAKTGEWVAGRCPNPACGRAHRVRSTLMVTVEEEKLPNLVTDAQSG